MNNETNRLAQLIATAADKELGTRPDGQPRRQDKAAALAIEAEYLFIRRSELPAAEYIERDGKTHVQINGSEAGTWPVKDNAATNRRWGLEYLAASIAIQEWHASEAERAKAKRRDELAREITEQAYGSEACVVGYRDASNPVQVAIDRIIELERNAA